MYEKSFRFRIKGNQIEKLYLYTLLYHCWDINIIVWTILAIQNDN